MLGGDTLYELRQSLMEAELAEDGGVSPRVSPFADLRDAGGLLQRAGFALPVIDGDRVTVSYADVLKLMHDLRGMGEANAVRARAGTAMHPALAARTDEIYRRRFGNGEGRLPATFQIIYLTAWAPAAGQQRALAPGSARSRLADALGTVELSAGDKARPR
jgi:hypothetical protein